MIFPQTRANVKHRSAQSLQMRGINLTDNYAEGQLEESKGISTNRFPYITTTDELQPVDTGIPSGYQPVSMFAWEKLFVVSDEPKFSVEAEAFDETKYYENGDYAVFPGGILKQWVVEVGPDWVHASWEEVTGLLVGYKCYYGGQYCGDAVNLELPKQYAVVNSKLVMWPDKIYFNLYDEEMSAHPLTTAPLLTTVVSGTIKFRKAVTT